MSRKTNSKQYLGHAVAAAAAAKSLQVSDSVRPHRRQPTRLLCPWDFPGKSTGEGCHCLLHLGNNECLSAGQFLYKLWDTVKNMAQSLETMNLNCPNS